MILPDRLTGVVLAGGKSSRFGSNKALQPYGNSTFLKRAISLIYPFGLETVVSGYYPGYENLSVPIIKDNHQDIGPLGGIHSVMTERRTDWFLFLTCDMPLLTREVLHKMVLHAPSGKVLGWQRSETDKSLFPLLIARSLLPEIEAAIAEKRYKLKRVLDKGNPEWLTVPAEWQSGFSNINSQKDLSIIQENNPVYI